MTPARAIACGLKLKKCDDPILQPTGFSAMLELWQVEAAGPIGRIYRAARDAKDKYLAFTEADVTDHMRAPVLEVRVRNVDTDMTTDANVKHVILLPGGKKDGAIQPLAIEDWNYDGTLAGAKFTRIGKAASFSLSSLPKGDIDVVIMSDTYGDVKVNISKDDRTRGGF
jgi:hypothetical protein